MNNNNQGSIYHGNNTILREATEGPLHIAAAMGLPLFVQEILKTTPELAFAFDANGLTPCHLAILNGHASVVRALVRSDLGPDIVNVKDNNGFLPIHAAIIKGNTQVFKELKYLCLPPAPMLLESTRERDTVLHLAARFCSLDDFGFLISVCADKEVVSRKDADGNTALHVAVNKGELEFVKVMLDSAVNSRVYVNAINVDGLTALDILNSANEIRIGQIIMRAGGKKATELSQTHTVELESGESEEDRRINIDIASFKTWVMFLRRDKDYNYRETGNALMVVAALIDCHDYVPGSTEPSWWSTARGQGTRASSFRR